MITVSRNGSAFPADARGAAVLYLNTRRLAPVPARFRTKKPVRDDFLDLRLTVQSLDQHFPPGADLNIANLNGEPSGTVDVDLDTPEALKAAPILLPTTDWVFGRKSAPRSHWLYAPNEPLDSAQVAYRDVDGTMLVELRGTGGITIIPPSIHQETGERIAWDQFTDDPAAVSLEALQLAVQDVAVAALLARHWPAQGWHFATMALAGGLLRGGLEHERVDRIVEALWKSAGDQDDPSDRQGAVRTTAEKLAAGENVTGWPKLRSFLGQRGGEVIDLVQEWLGIAKPAAPLVPVAASLQDRPWPPPLAAEAFHGLAGKIVRTIEPVTEADLAALLFQLLVGFGNLIGRTAHFRAEADLHYTNEFLVLIGKSSKARKGSSFGHQRALFRAAEEAWEVGRVQSGLSSGEGMIWAVRDPITKMEKFKEGKQVTYQEVVADPGEEDKRLLAFEPEYANVLKQTERQGNTLSAVLRQAWETGNLRTITKNSPARATDAHVSLIGHITSEELRRLLTTTEIANGFANRNLWVCVQRSKELPDLDDVHLDQEAMKSHEAELAQTIAFAKRAGLVRRDDAAKSVWREVYSDLSRDRYGLAGSLLTRAEAHVMRLALIYAVLDRSTSITAEHLLAALACWQYVEDSVTHIFGDSLGDPLADDLLNLLRQNPAGATRSDLSAFLGRHQTAERVGRALGLLLRTGKARMEQEKTDGRPAERWHAVR